MNATTRKIFEKQLWHFGYIVLAVSGIIGLFSSWDWGSGTFLGRSTLFWVILNLSVSIVHQLFTWFGFRTQLYLQLFTRKLRNKGFRIYELIFFIFFFSRVLLSFPLTFSERNTIDYFYLLSFTCGILLALPMFYTWYSVIRYFGLARACGEDHFKLEEYRNKPFVKRGIYKYVNNSMYSFATLIFIVPSLLLGSIFGLIIGLFDYCYVWIHYLTVERPDMQEIYS